MTQRAKEKISCPTPGRTPLLHKGIFGEIPPALVEGPGAGLLTVAGAAPVKRGTRPCQPATRGDVQNLKPPVAVRLTANAAITGANVARTIHWGGPCKSTIGIATTQDNENARTKNETKCAHGQHLDVLKPSSIRRIPLLRAARSAALPKPRQFPACRPNLQAMERPSPQPVVLRCETPLLRG